MKVMIVASNKLGSYSPFIMDQVNELSKRGVEFSFFPITGKGILGYLKSLPALKKAIRKENPNMLHAHFGLSGLLAVLQRKRPTIITFHGSDINVKKNWYLSKIAYVLSKRSIFVSEDLKKTLKAKKGEVIPCGIDLEIFHPHDKLEARKKFGLDLTKKYVLFSSSFNRPVKNYPLAKAALDSFDPNEVELLELRGFARKEIPLIMSAVDCGLVTSHSESGPLFVKEAIACGLPVVSVDVGEVKKSFEGTEGNYLVSRDKEEIFQSLKKALDQKKRSISNGKEKDFCNKEAAHRVEQEYIKIISKK